MATRESYQKICLRLYVSWEPGSQVPREFAALATTVKRFCIEKFVIVDYFTTFANFRLWKFKMKLYPKKNCPEKLTPQKNWVQKVWSKSDNWQLWHCWYVQMLSGHMLPGQMLSWQLAYVKGGPRKLSLKFGQNWVSNSWDTPDMDKCFQD